MRTLQREERKITCRENGADERTSTMATAKTTMMGQAGVRLNPPEQLALHTMPRYDGAGFTHVEADYSKPWLPSESRPEATPGEGYSRPWLAALAGRHWRASTPQ
ncbi:hypothetical protein DER44DRAFT_802745 [Fusarium oxysporum]|nr:hypothetical protein DER44DRAFT_802745 [Fusarium oxysporum]